MSQFIRRYVKGCAQCQQNKIYQHPTQPALRPIDPPTNTRPFSQIAMDLITDLLTSITHDGKKVDTILSIVDHGLLKGAIFIPTSKTFSTAFHPQTDGTTERFNQEIAAYLSIYSARNPNEWAKHLPFLEYVHNSRTHSDRQNTPYEIIMGMNPPGIPSIMETTTVESTEQRIKNLDRIRNEAIASHKIAAQRMAKRINSGFKPFTLGQRVWLEAKNLTLPYPSRKISPKRQGPFKVKHILSPWTYELQLPPTWKIHSVFHASLLTPFHENDIHGPSHAEPPPELIEGQEEYEIEGIINHKTQDGLIWYLVKWKGYNDTQNQWLKEEELKNATEYLEEYKATHDNVLLPTSRSNRIRRKQKSRR